MAKKTSTQSKRRAQAQTGGPDIKGQLLVWVLAAAGLLPLTALRYLGASLGWLLWRLNTQAAKVSRENLTYAYPDMNPQRREALVRQSLQESGKTGFEMAGLWNRPESWVLNSIVDSHNEELLRRARGSGNGLLILSPHIGNWEVLCPYLNTVCAPVTVMYQPAQLPTLDKLIKQARLRSAQVATADRAGVMILLKALRNGESVGVLPDQVPTEGAGEFADFYSRPALTMTLSRQLHKKTNADIVMVYARRVKGGFKVVCEPPHPDIYSPQPEVALRGLNLSVEQCIDAQPEQYQWQYKRYRRQPQGQPRPYQYRNTE